MVEQTVKFRFRVWLHPADPADVEVWYDHLEPTISDSQCVTEWLADAMAEVDHYAEFKLDPLEHWQVLGSAVLRSEGGWGVEYTEEVTIESYEAAVVSAAWLDATDAEDVQRARAEGRVFRVTGSPLPFRSDTEE